MKVIFNDAYGDFGFSADFEAAYKAATGHAITARRLFVRGGGSIRVDPVAIRLIEEHGTEWASATGAALTIYEFPDIFADYWEIEEYGGNETVHIQLAEALADVLHTYMEQRELPSALIAMESQYRRLTEAHASLQKTVSEPALKESADTVTHTDDSATTSYFSA